MDYKKILISAVFVMLISLIINTAGLFLNIDQYESTSRLWNPQMLSLDILFYTLLLIFGFILGLIFTLTYMFISKSIRQNSVLMTGLVYGGMLFVLIGVPISLYTYLFFSIPLTLLVSLTIQNLLVFFISGLGIVYIMRYTCKFSNAGGLK